tara:strand:- start:10690 stop:11409 length:720 start_codon:yes stop_codon:yes gene_type:complete
MKERRFNEDGSLQITSKRGFPAGKEYLSSVLKYTTLGAPMGVGGRNLVFVKDEIFQGQGVSQPVLDAQNIASGELTLTWDNLDSYLPLFSIYNLGFSFGSMNYGTPFTFHFLNSALYAGSSAKRTDGQFSPWYFYQSSVSGGDGLPGQGGGEIAMDGPPGSGGTQPITGQWIFAMTGAQDTTMDFPGIGNNSEIEIRMHIDRAEQIAKNYYDAQLEALNPQPGGGIIDPGGPGDFEELG